MVEKIIDFNTNSIANRTIENLIFGIFEIEKSGNYLFGFDISTNNFTEEELKEEILLYEQKLNLLKKFKYINSFLKLIDDENIFVKQLHKDREDIFQKYKEKYSKETPIFLIDTGIFRNKFEYLCNIRLSSYHGGFKELQDKDGKEKIYEIYNQILKDEDELIYISSKLEKSDLNLFKDLKLYEGEEYKYYLLDFLFFIFFDRKPFLHSIYKKIIKKESENELYITDDLMYIKNKEIIKSLLSDQTYICKTQEVVFLNILFESITPVDGVKIESEVNEKLGKTKGSATKDIYYNLLKSLKKEKMIGEKEQFVELSSGKFILINRL